jgi:pyruvate,orthophosphate dikinase
LGALHRQILPVLHQLSGAVDRYRQYPVRLDQALRRVREGERDWVARPVIDSYHTVWFELHEDLLAVLGRHRGKLDNSPNSILAPREPR